MSITPPELSICLSDLGQEAKEAMHAARKMGFRAIDAAAVCGAISPGELSHSGRRHLLKHLGDLGLRLGSLRGPADGRGYADPAMGERRLETMRQIIALAADIAVPIVSTTLGAGSTAARGTAAHGGESSSGQSAQSAESAPLAEALSILADDADRAGVMVAVETAGIGPSELGGLLSRINCPLLVACCDSGAMLMRGDDPHHISRALPGRIRLVRARDAAPGTPESAGHEVALGEGQLDAPRFLADLEQGGFCGDIILTRTGGASPVDDLRRAREQISRLLRAD